MVLKFSLSCQTNNSPTLFPDSQLVCFSLNNAYSASLAYIWIISHLNVFNRINLPLVGSFWREVSISFMLVQSFSPSLLGVGARQGREERRKGDGLLYPRVRGPPAGMGQVELGWLFGTLLLVSGDEEGRNVYGLWWVGRDFSSSTSSRILQHQLGVQQWNALLTLMVWS